MILEELNQFNPVDGVLALSDFDKVFEMSYLQIKKFEKRDYPDAEIKLLPFASKSNPHKAEWIYKSKSFLRLKFYLSYKKSGLNILDLGCGSGWFASKILKESNHNIYCVDFKLTDLKQGAKLFSSNKIKFIYADLFSIKLPKSSFDLVIINSAIHFFSDFKNLMRELFYLLTPQGEIHIINSPFYKEDEIEIEKNKIFKYYDYLGVPLMKEKHFFHTLGNLNSFNYSILYNPYTFKTRFLAVAFGKDSPYPWILVKR